MTKPNSGVFEAPKGGGTVYSYENTTDAPVQPEYAELTAPRVCCLEAFVDGTRTTKAWAGGGGAHSWWTEAGGRFLRYPLKPGQTLTVTLSDEGCFRIDWYDTQ